MASTSEGLRVAFLHPDLGLGGAERLVVDAAVELVQHGHTVDMYTAYYDPNRCFEETRTGGFRVSVAGSWFPRHIAGKLLAVCAYIRCLIVALHIAWVSWQVHARECATQASMLFPLPSLRLSAHPD